MLDLKKDHPANTANLFGDWVADTGGGYGTFSTDVARVLLPDNDKHAQTRYTTPVVSVETNGVLVRVQEECDGVMYRDMTIDDAIKCFTDLIAWLNVVKRYPMPGAMP